MRRSHERLIVFLVGAIQFVNILDFVIVMPLGLDFARALDIPASQVGWLGVAYTSSAAISGIIGSLFLDRFDRRVVLALAMGGLVVGTAAGGLATSFHTLLAARAIAGFFGGPATSLAFSIIADTVPAERRGAAMGAVAGAFSAASVLGIPLGVELAARGGWQMPFYAVAGMGLVVTGMAIYFLPPMTGHLAQLSKEPVLLQLERIVRRPLVQLSYAMTALVMCGGFVVVSMLSPYVQANLGFPRENLSGLYLKAGVVSFFTSRLGGLLIDRYGSSAVAALGVLILLPVQYVLLVHYDPAIPIYAIFMVFMLGMGLRNVAHVTLTSKVPPPAERARFASLQSAVQHAASAFGAFISTQILVELPNHKLLHVERVGYLAMGLAALMPGVVWVVESRVRLRDRKALG